MSTAVLRVWEEYQHLSAEDRRQFFDLLRDEPDKPYDFIEPIPMRPPGYFKDLYTKEEMELENRLAKSNVVEVPQDLE